MIVNNERDGAVENVWTGPHHMLTMLGIPFTRVLRSQEYQWGHVPGKGYCKQAPYVLFDYFMIEDPVRGTCDVAYYTVPLNTLHIHQRPRMWVEEFLCHLVDVTSEYLR